MPPGVINTEGYASLEETATKVRRLLESADMRDVVVVNVEDATYQEICGVVWPFQDMLRVKYGERLRCGTVLPSPCAEETVSEVA